MDRRKRWLEERKRGIGGSEIGAVLGHNPYRNAYDVYIDKTSDVVMESEPNGHMKRGKFLEPLVKRLYQKETGHRSVYAEAKPKANVLTVDPLLVQSIEEPWMLGSPDDLIVAEGQEGVGVLECKCPGVATFNKIRREGFPQYVIDQAQQYLAIMGLMWGAIAVFSAEHWELIHTMINTEPELQEEMVRKGREFWENHVQKRKPPTLELDDAASKATVKGKLVNVGDNPTWVDAVTQYRDAVDLEVEAKEAKTAAINRLKSIMGEAECVEGNGIRVYHKTNKGRESVDTKRLKSEYADVYEAVKKKGNPYKTFKTYELAWRGK